MRHRRFVLQFLLIVSGLAMILTGHAAPTVSGQWTPAGTMGEARAGAAAVLLADGRVLVIGGSTATGPTSGAEVSSAGADGTGGVFAPAAPMSTARTHHTAVKLLDGRVLVVGGETPNDAGGGEAGANVATSSAEIYDPLLDTWTPAGAMTEPRARHTASLLADGRVLIAGGDQAGAARGTLEIFNPSTSAFTSDATGITPRTWHAAATLADGRVLLAGGVDGASALASADIFNPADGAVVQTALTSPRAAASATTLLNGQVLIAGGHDGEHDLGSAEVFDPATNVSTVAGTAGTAATMASQRSGHQAFLLPANNSVLIVGGTSEGTPLATAELFVPWAGEFRQTGVLHEARTAAAGTPLAQEGQLVIAGGTGGEDGTAALSSVERYAFATIKTDRDDYAPGQTVTITGQGWEPGETVTLLLHEAPHALWHDDRTLTAIADANGRIFNNEFAPEAHHMGVRFYLTATGAVSQVQITFTDGELLTAELVGTANDVTVEQGTTANFTISVSSPGQPLKCSATILNPATATVRTVYALSATGVLSSSTPSSPLAFFAGAPLSGPNCATTWNFAPTPYSVAATITAAATTPVGNYSIVLSAGAGTTTATTPGTGGGSSLADATPTTITVHVVAPADSTPPVVTPTVSGTSGSNGWYTSDVTVSWAVSDPESSITSTAGCETTTVTTDTAGTVITCSATSAGGTTTQSVTIKRDSSAPEATLSVSAGTVGTNGWYTSDVTVHTSGVDTISGPVTCTADQQQTAETAGTGFNGKCTNDAGLETNASPLTIKLDKTGPTGVALAVTAGTLGANGWYRSDVTVTTTGADTISVPVVCTAAQHQTSDTPGTAFNGLCKNDAGLETQGAALTVKVDKTAPIITIVTPADGGSYVLNASIDAQYTCQDATSGPATCSGPVASGADFATGSVGPNTFTVNATDNAGNTATRANVYHVTFSTAACLGQAGHSVLQPINIDGSSVFKQKSTVPVKFRVCDANGVSIGANTVAAFNLVFVTAGTTTTTVNEPVDSTTPDATFRWDPSAQQWIFNTNTKSLDANRTYGFVITLTDASVIEYQFGLK